ncbi:hypothetical protein BZA05DRAFT_399893 [Tricharina praecox]|uniref:uncharacterized protein n=1 Tax=Tricharina praecox TaxID=43433 RepID=UPI002220E09F|nr:uncharacterized protein BZA05DRAFT_399893 [Tricharina praecox]KAI5850667.1 hypothetical protein BZA05DRAFT_399893 [Tricharina praecox]
MGRRDSFSHHPWIPFGSFFFDLVLLPSLSFRSVGRQGRRSSSSLYSIFISSPCVCFLLLYALSCPVSYVECRYPWLCLYLCVRMPGVWGRSIISLDHTPTWLSHLPACLPAFSVD